MRAAAALLLVVAGCGGDALVEEDAVAVGDLNAYVAAPTVEEVLARGENATAPVALPAAAGFDHLGTWAATPALCDGGAWRFARGGVETDGETSCRVTGETVTSDNAKKLALACTAEGIETVESWALVRRGDGSMTVARSAGDEVPASVTLRRC